MKFILILLFAYSAIIKGDPTLGNSEANPAASCVMRFTKTMVLVEELLASIT